MDDSRTVSPAIPDKPIRVPIRWPWGTPPRTSRPPGGPVWSPLYNSACRIHTQQKYQLIFSSIQLNLTPVAVSVRLFCLYIVSVYHSPIWESSVGRSPALCLILHRHCQNCYLPSNQLPWCPALVMIELKILLFDIVACMSSTLQRFVKRRFFSMQLHRNWLIMAGLVVVRLLYD